MKTADYRNILYQELSEKKFVTSEDLEKYYDNQCNKLFTFMEEKNKTLNIYETAKNKSYHQHFWEVLVGNTLAEAELDIKKDCRDAAPDFFFEIDGMKIHIEAKAPTEGMIEDLKPKGIKVYDASELLKDDSFELGFITGEKSILRLTSILSATIKQIETSFVKHGTVKQNDKIIIAINGNDVVKNKEIHKDNFNYGITSYGFHMLCALYGLSGNEFLDPKTNKYYYAQEPLYKGKVPIVGQFFCPNNKTPIDGIIYSNVNMRTYLQNAQPFLFFPNPEKEDLGHYFPFCKNVGCPIKFDNNIE